jgi:hypothetical protein
MKRSLGIVICTCVFTVSTIVSLPTFASPVGTDYFFNLDARVIASGVSGTKIEGHGAWLTFDGSGESVATDYMPVAQPNPIPPFVEGTVLWVTEENNIINANTEELVFKMWTDNVNSGLPLFNNILAPYSEYDWPIFLGITELYWPGFSDYVQVTDHTAYLSYGIGAPLTQIDFLPSRTDRYGDGTEASPFGMDFAYDTADFVNSSDEKAIYMELHLTLSHVPIPPAVWLFGTGLLGLVGMARRKKTS